LNLPLNKTFEPQGWWGLFHETGHAFFNVNPEIINFNAEPLSSMISSDLELVGAEQWKKRNEMIKMFTEIIADIYDFKLCFLGNIDFYMETVWSYLGEQISSSRNIGEKRYKLGDYLLRSYFVFIYYLLFEVPGRKMNYEILDYQKIKELSAIFYTRLKKVFLKEGRQDIFDIEKEENVVREIANKFANIKGFILEFKSAFDRLNLKPEKRRILFQSRKTSTLVRRIERGEILDSNEIQNPMVLLLKFIQRKKFSFKSQIAMILTFWNYYEREYMPKLMDKILVADSKS
jgi:hypothetical protein